ncbi:hypothetical protein [uncultured Microbacterium sp.]|uniref:hypothetical protein n=1 Tax=uncultured Microbacterium sp. TaxID=191216 RepID=UPI0035CA2E2E
MDHATPDGSLEPAAEHLDVAIAVRPGASGTKTLRTLVNFALAAVTGDSAPLVATQHDLVVTRRETGGEVLRAAAGSLSEADALLQRVRRDLETKSVGEFLSEWRLPDEPAE